MEKNIDSNRCGNAGCILHRYNVRRHIFMKNNRKWKTTAFILTCGLTVALEGGAAAQTSAGSGLNAGIFATMDSYYNTDIVVSATNTVTTMEGQSEDAAATDTTVPADTAATDTAVPVDTTICGYTNLGIAQVDSSLNVREQPDTNSDIVGKMQSDAGCEILEDDGEWLKIESGQVTGYVKAEYIITGEAAVAKAQEVMKTIATVTTQTLNVRAEMNTDCTKLALMPEGEELEVLNQYDGWVEVDLDGDVGYASTDYVEISQQLPKAQTMTELKYGQGVSDTRVSLVAYATQFVGNPYVWGGTSLTRGADCSGFVLSVYANYGVYLPHSSRAQAGCGTRISASEAQPGDLFFYGSGKGINHVAIYIGNGQIVHASSPSTGIKISNAYYRSPVCVVRVLGN
jgi:cell wall-associated NlpC family hydrolase